MTYEVPIRARSCKLLTWAFPRGRPYPTTDMTAYGESPLWKYSIIHTYMSPNRDAQSCSSLCYSLLEQLFTIEVSAVADLSPMHVYRT
jgi:hypothetical protein